MPKQEDLREQRIDKWLWVARFFKSRTIASDAVSGGKVHCNGERSKPGRMIKAGDQLSIRKGVYEYEITVNGLNRQRQSAAAAQALYTESEASLERRELRREQARLERMSVPGTPGRPNKRDRRILLAVKQRR